MGALSATGSTFVPVTDAQGFATYRAYSVFLRDSSWVNKQKITTAADRAEVLAHEQLHFDIAELAARRLRRRIAQGLAAGEALDGPQVGQDFARIQAEEARLSAAFDQEVVQAGGHRWEAPVRRRWQLRMARALQELAAYAPTAATCP